MSDIAIAIQELGKMYKLYRRPMDKVFDAFGLDRWLFWRKNYYQEFWALRNVNLEVYCGERLGIIGRNGAGKSTLLKIITGNVYPTEGRVQLSGKIQALMELGTGFHPEFTGRENIYASLAYQGLKPAKIREKEEEIIEFAELEDFIDQPIKTYSAGMYTRLAFSTATIVEPEILIIDEVLGAGDAYFAGKCMERMKRLTYESGATVLFVSHDLGSVQSLCERVIWIDRGRIVRQGEPLTVIKDYSRQVRQEDEARLRARDLKVLKKHSVLLDRHEDVYTNLLFRLVSEDGVPPVVGPRIYSIALWQNQQKIASIDVGAPMDNSPDHLHYILDAPGYMDWSPASRDQQGSYREYKDMKSKYRHAPFEFAIPKTHLTKDLNKQPICVELELSINTGTIAIDAHDGKNYIRLGCVESIIGQKNQKRIFKLPYSLFALKNFLIKDTISNSENQLTLTQTNQSLYSHEYGSGDVRITAIRLYDSNDKENRILQANQPMRVEIGFETSENLYNPVFVFCIYLPDGKCASQWISSSKQMGYDILNGSGTVSFQVEKLLLGRGAYVASVAIFKELRTDGTEGASYHVLDRCIHFQILTELDNNIDWGICLQPFTASINYSLL